MLKALIPDKPGTEPLAEALRALKTHLLFAAGFSALVNVLYLAPTLYMLQVYDRVVPTGGILTLVLVTVVVAFALGTLAALDVVRQRILVRAGLRLDRRLAASVMDRVLTHKDGGARVRQAMREFDQIRSAVSGQGALALLDAPWTPIYLIICTLLHPLIGLLTLAGGAGLFVLALFNERATRRALEAAQKDRMQAYAAQEAVAGQAEVVRALGMRRAMIGRHIQERDRAEAGQSEAQFTSGLYSGAIKFARLMLQSAALGLGAWLAVEGQISAGAIIAASVLLSRAVQPIELLVGAWGGLVQARASWNTLTDLFAATGEQDRPRTALPAPTGRLALDQVGVRSPAQGRPPLLKHVSFDVEPGQSLGIIGPSGAGKTTLARVLSGGLVPDAGTLRLDGAEYSAWDSERLARHIGYLPQNPSLFAGTITENISRFAEPGPETDAKVVAAAQQAGVHDMILKLAEAYDTRLGPDGAGLSAGQAQRLALARALYDDPCLIILDEPNAHLDQQGEAALARAINAARARGAAVIVIAHRAGVLSHVDRLMVLRDGTVDGIGPRDEIIARLQPGSRQGRPQVVDTGT